MKKFYILISVFIIALSDLVLMSLSFFIGLLVTDKLLVTVDQSIYRENLWNSAIIWLISSAIFRLYTTNAVQNLNHLYKATVLSVCSFAIVLICYLYFSGQTSAPIEIFAVVFPILGMAFVLSRVTATAIREQLPENLIINKETSGVLTLNSEQ